MGAGASAGLMAGINSASDAEIKDVLAGMSPETCAKLVAALDAKKSTSKPCEGKPKLTYFNGAGRVLALRVAMHKAFGKDGWTDHRIEFADWAALKPTAPLGFLPFLTLPDGRLVSQTDSILRWAGKKSGLYPTDDEQGLIVDEICCTVFEALNKTPRAPDDAEMKRLREEYMAGFLTTALKQLETRVDPGPFVLGETLCMADLVLSTLSNMIATDDFTHVPASFLDTFPKVKAHNERTRDHAILKAYLAEYPN
mmetsp:Transcript_32303/g.68797  ORF Transcript_32303/g.68797 Transcript_32303/m.68797 type:complete len:254 (-) Transcript_32303:154-915(-)|eukprot:CAMPEP_0180486598 /NCGR_PEP_ID=MMETSP1036_2-20121128/37077_1 /TAXON_ID=632150 /ORGANISM="Azadinium spinosum, Strain 3D9" /LENGTH=253 /DNA_ID=CAMNT_0022494555 /DNA_START=79 /DNA_END=840 /DNA_ORIENTATION=-